MQKRLTQAELEAGIIMQDPLLFPMFFWRDDLTMPDEEEYGVLAGKQILSREQKLMYTDESKRILFCTGRKIAKSLIIEARIIQWAIMNERPTEDAFGDDEALVVAPSEGHLKPIQMRVWKRISKVSIFKKMVISATRGNKPVLEWSTGLTVHLRVEGMSGTDTNMAGIRAKWVLGDEMAFGDFSNHDSRLQTALPNAQWLYAGVPNNSRTSPFYSLDATSLGNTWSRHKYSTFINPLYWFPAAKKALLDNYGSKVSPGYVTQVLGQWGEASISSFPPSAIAIHNDMYYLYDIDQEKAKHMLKSGRIRDYIDIPAVRCERFAIGNDQGYSPDPSVYIFGIQRTPEDVKRNIWRQYARLTMRTVPIPNQRKILTFIINNLFPGAQFYGYGTDDRKMIHELNEHAPQLADLCYWTFPAMEVVERDENDAPLIDDNGKVVKTKAKQYWTEKLKSAMAFWNAQIPAEPIYMLLAQDEGLINELVNTTEARRDSGNVVYYGQKIGGHRMLDNNTDALRYLVASILKTMYSGKKTTTESELLQALGWINSSASWSSPWN